MSVQCVCLCDGSDSSVRKIVDKLLTLVEAICL